MDVLEWQAKIFETTFFGGGEKLLEHIWKLDWKRKTQAVRKSSSLPFKVLETMTLLYLGALVAARKRTGSREKFSEV